MTGPALRFVAYRLRYMLAGLAGFALTGCLATPLGQGQADLGEAVMQRALLADGEVVVVPPQGYCIQRDSLKTSRRGGFALVASCAQLTGFMAGYTVAPVVMTVTAVERETDGPEPSGAEIAAALQGQQVLRQLHGDGLTVVQVTSDTPISAESDVTHWRGVMVVNGYTVGLALYGAKGSAEAGDRGLTQLMWLAEQLRSESPTRERAVAAFAVSEVPLGAVASDQGGPVRPKARPLTR